MTRKVVILSGSPQRKGNTSLLASYLKDSLDVHAFQVDIIDIAFLKFKFPGCVSCRACQKNKEYGCVIKDDVKSVQMKMLDAEIVIMATPLYFFGPSAQIKIIIDRMFSLYKWDNDKGTMKTPLKGKTFALLASAYEDIGLDVLEAPFALTAEYTGMNFYSLIVPNAGVSGDLINKPDLKSIVNNFAKTLI